MAKLAINGGPKTRTEAPPPWPVFDESELKAVEAVVRSRNWGGFPEPNTIASRFAEKFAAYHGAAHGISAANGTVTLEVALRAAGVQAGDEVIVPPLTWVATAAAAVSLNAVPVFADIDPETYCLDPARVEEAVTDRTRAIIPVHLGCRMADMDRLMALAAKRKLTVIEDCAHAHGGKWSGRGAGSIGHLGSFSFQSSKLMTAGEGGIVLTSDAMLAEKCHSLVNCGRKESGYDSFEGWLLGWNARITDLQAAILEVQLTRLAEQTRKRDENAKYLSARLAEIPGLAPLKRDPRLEPAPNYQYLFRYEAARWKGVHRDKFVAALEAEGFHVDAYFYIPLYQWPLFTVRAADYPEIRRRYGEEIGTAGLSCPVAERAAYHEAVWLHHPILLGTRADVDGFVDAVLKIRENLDELA